MFDTKNKKKYIIHKVKTYLNVFKKKNIQKY